MRGFFSDRHVELEGNAIRDGSNHMAILSHELYASPTDIEFVFSHHDFAFNLDSYNLVALAVKMDICGSPKLEREEFHLEATLEVKERVVQTSKYRRHKEFIGTQTLTATAVSLRRVEYQSMSLSRACRCTGLAVPLRFSSIL